MKERISSQPIRTTIAIVIIASAAWIFRGLLVTFVIQPIGWLLWAAWRLLASIDRNVLWLSLIIACSLLMIRLVPPGVVGGEDDHDEPPQSWKPGDRLAHWRTWTARSMTDVAGRAALRLSLESMADNVAKASRIPLPGSLHAPPDARDHGPGTPAGIARLGVWLSRMLPDHRRRREAHLMDSLLNWMESALEIKHGR